MSELPLSCLLKVFAVSSEYRASNMRKHSCYQNWISFYHWQEYSIIHLAKSYNFDSLEYECLYSVLYTSAGDTFCENHKMYLRARTFIFIGIDCAHRFCVEISAKVFLSYNLVVVFGNLEQDIISDWHFLIDFSKYQSCCIEFCKKCPQLSTHKSENDWFPKFLF